MSPRVGCGCGSARAATAIESTRLIGVYIADRVQTGMMIIKDFVILVREYWDKDYDRH